MRRMRHFLLLACCSALLVAVSATTASAKSFYDFQTKTLKGAPADLGIYRGKVALVVNVASYCEIGRASCRERV